jgi:hypothetical protein
MAIGFNLPGIPSQIRGTAEEAGAVPDLGQAMMQGFRSNLENVQGYPRQLAQQLLSNQLRNKILGVQEKYAEPMAKTSYDQALANLQHQGMVNKFYPELMRSQLSGAGLSQAHQRMVNDQLKRQIDRQRTYDKLLEEYRNQGLPTQQAQQLAAQATAQAHPEQPMESLSQSLLGAEMPDYLSSMAPQQQAPSYAEALGQAAYTPMQQPNIGLRYTPFELSNKLTQQEIARKLQEASLPGGSLTSLQAPVQRQAYDALFGALSPEVTASLGAQMPSEGQAPITQAMQLAQEAPSYLQRPEEPVMEMPVAQPAMEQPQQPQPYAQQLQQAGYNAAGANPVYAAEDKLYLERPDFRQELKQQFPNIGVKQFNDFPRNRVITTETLPSGATKTTMQQLPGTLPSGGMPTKITAAVLNTPAGRSVFRNNLVETYGKDSQEVKDFDEQAKVMSENEQLARDVQKQKLEIGKGKLEAQKETNDLRRQSLEIQKRKGLGKVGLALSDYYDAQAGYVPGTKTKFATPEDQQIAIKTIQGDINKVATDPSQRAKLVAARQIDQTINNLNVDDLVKYSGIFGKGALTTEQLKSGLSLDSSEYQRYSNAAKQAELLAKQVRMFYGASIQPTETKQLKLLTNPTSWSASPDTAKQNYLSFVNTLKQETDILRGFFVFADNANFKNKIDSAKATKVSDELNSLETEMRKRGIL